MKHFCTTLFATLAVAGSAWAQPTGSPEHQTDGLSRIELRSGVTSLYAGGWVPFPAIQARLNISQRFAADVITDFDTTQKLKPSAHQFGQRAGYSGQVFSLTGAASFWGMVVVYLERIAPASFTAI